MKSFQAGFFKAAARKTEVSSKEEKSPLSVTPTSAGFAAGGAVAAGHVGSAMIRDRLENRAVKPSKSLKDFKSSLKPGDIIFTRYRSKDSPNLEIGKHEIPIKMTRLVQGVSGSKNYHGAIYLGRGRVSQAVGSESPLETSSLKEMYRGQDVKAYRPTAAKPKEVRRAVEFARKAKGTPYANTGQLIAHGLGQLAGISPGSKKCKVGPEGNIVCTTLVTHAYPKQFPKKLMTPNEMRAQKGVKLVTRHSPIGSGAMGERLITRTILPAARGLKWGLGAAALTAGAQKVHQIYKDSTAKKNSRTG